MSRAIWLSSLRTIALPRGRGPGRLLFAVRRSRLVAADVNPQLRHTCVFAQYWDKVTDSDLQFESVRSWRNRRCHEPDGYTQETLVISIATADRGAAPQTRVMSSSGGLIKGTALILLTARQMYKQGGLRLYFRGLTAGLVGVFPYSAIDMSSFEFLKLAYTKWSGNEPGIPGSLCFGATSGGIGATSVYPLNLVRTRLQAQGTPAHPQRYTGIKDAARQCYAREGVRGFYKGAHSLLYSFRSKDRRRRGGIGLTPTLAKVVPAVAISYTVYDQSKKVLFGPEEHDHDAVLLDSNDDES